MYLYKQCGEVTRRRDLQIQRSKRKLTTKNKLVKYSSLVNQQHQGQALHGFLSKPGKMICLHIRLLCVRKLLLYVRKLFQCIRKLLLCTKKVIVMNSSRTEDVTKCYMRRLAEQAGAELCQAQYSLSLDLDTN